MCAAVFIDGQGHQPNGHTHVTVVSPRHDQIVDNSFHAPQPAEAQHVVDVSGVAPDEEDDVVISCENIHKTYLLGIEGVPALRGVSLDIYKGEFVLIFGTSGGGKSSLLNILGTIDVPTKGNLSIFGRRVTDGTSDVHLAKLRLSKVGFVFQSFNLLSTMTATENVALPMILEGSLSRKEITERAHELLREVGLGHRLNHYPSMLSGGEQQRVTIARSLANSPGLLLLDEPTGDLDTRNTKIIMDILTRLNKERGLTMVMVTHDVYMKGYATRIVSLRDGRLQTVDKVPPEVRDHNIVKLRRQAQELLQQKTMIQLDDNNRDEQGERKIVREVRRPQDYQTYAGEASMKPEFRGNPYLANSELFAKLLGSKNTRVAREGSGAEPSEQQQDASGNDFYAPEAGRESSPPPVSEGSNPVDWGTIASEKTGPPRRASPLAQLHSTPADTAQQQQRHFESQLYGHPAVGAQDNAMLDQAPGAQLTLDGDAFYSEGMEIEMKPTGASNPL